eukprot:gene24453-10459_t
MLPGGSKEGLNLGELMCHSTSVVMAAEVQTLAFTEETNAQLKAAR